MLDAGDVAQLSRVTVVTDTPGFTAEIRTLSSTDASGPGPLDSDARSVGSSTVFPLLGKSSRYYVVWITNLGGQSSVHVNEVRAR